MISFNQVREFGQYTIVTKNRSLGKWRKNKGTLLEITKEKVLGHLDEARRQALGRYGLFTQDPKFNFSLYSSRRKNSE